MARLILYCERVMEAAWLAALICVPLFFVPWGESIQGEKNYILRSLAAVLLAAWAIRSLLLAGFYEGSFRHFWTALARRLNNPVTITAAVSGLLLALATLLSLSPWESFWGNNSRRIGSYTPLCCLVFFLAIVVRMRTQAQIQRLISATILASIPIGLYAAGQRFGIEPMLAEGADMFRVGATLANPIFLGAYLVMILPLTLGRFFRHFNQPRQASIRKPRLGALAYGVIAAAQFLAILFTASRGPILGLLAGLFVFALMLGMVWSKRILVSGTLGLGAALVLGLGLLSWPGGPLQGVTKWYWLERFSGLFDPESTSSGRKFIWEAGFKAAHFSTPAALPGNEADPWHALRFWIGYGPEQAGYVTRPFMLRDYNLANADHLGIDRIHHDFWELLLTSGALGLAAYLILTSLILYGGCQALGWVLAAREKAWYWGLFWGAGLYGTLFLSVWQGPEFIGLGLRFGTVAGFVIYLLWRFWPSPPASAADLPLDRSLTLIGLLAGMIAHLTEVSFAFPVESTLLSFWVFTGLVVVLGSPRHLIEVPEIPPTPKGVVASAPGGKNPGKDRCRTARDPNPPAASFVKFWRELWIKQRPELAASAMVALIFVNLGAMLIQNVDASTVWQTIDYSLTRLLNRPGARTWGPLFSVVAIWVLSAAVVAREITLRNTGAASWARSFLMILAFSGCAAFIDWLALAKQTTELIPSAKVTLETASSFVQEYTDYIEMHNAIVLGLVLLLALFLPERTPSLAPLRRPWLVRAVAIAGVSGLFIGAVLVFRVQLNWSKAGVWVKWAKTFHERRKPAIAAAMCEEGIRKMPLADEGHGLLGEVLTVLAATPAGAQQRDELLKRAEQALEFETSLKPLNAVTYSRRGKFYTEWAELETDADRKAGLARKALEFYQQAARLDPGNHEWWYRIAYVQFVHFNALDEAIRSLRHSIELFPKYAWSHGLFGDILYEQGLSITDSKQNQRLEAAASRYRLAAELATPHRREDYYRYRKVLGLTQARLEDYSGAIASYEEALRNCSDAERWSNEETLARLRAKMGDTAAARLHVRRALELAPEPERPGLLQLEKQILRLSTSP